MPTYSYSCKDCGVEHDIVQAMSDPTLTECPSCGGSMRKLFGNVGVVFKGSGFYRTDSRGTTSDTVPAKKSDSGAAKTESTPASSSSTSSSSSSSSSGSSTPASSTLG